MNTIHKFSMAIVAVVMIVGFSAFKMSETKIEVKQHENSTVLLDLWSFNGTNNAQIKTPSSYDKITGTPPPCPGVALTVCIIEAPDNGTGEPDLSQHIDPSDPLSPTYADLIDEAMKNKVINDVVKDFRSF